MLLEFLSIFDLITPVCLSLGWLLPTLGLSIKLYLLRGQSNQINLPSICLPASWNHRIVLFGVGLILLITFVVAWLVPPQTADSLVYHMSRVAHWAQNQSIKPFATGIRFQNTMSQAAELIVLNFYVLTGSDKLANLIQWFAMAGSLIGVSLLAAQLGATRAGLNFALAFAASIPMGIVQASSTMTDYVVAFWLICVVSEGLCLITSNSNWTTAVFLGLSVGLSIATKPTAFAFLLPFAVFIPVLLLRQMMIKQFALMGLVVVFGILVLNMGHYARNYSLYGSPLGHEGTIRRHANESINAKSILSNSIRHASLHVGTIWPDLNDWIYRQIVKIHVKTGIDINDPKTTFTEFRILRFSTNENITGNALHAVFIVASFILTLTLWSRFNSTTKIHGIAVAAGFIVFSALFKFQIFASRLQLPFFVLSAPFIGTVFSRIHMRRWLSLIGGTMILASIPWLFRITSRPIIPMSGESKAESILFGSREDLYFQSAPSPAITYKNLVDVIDNQDCNIIGLILSGSSPEYLWWVLLDAPRENLRIEWIVSDSPTANYEDPTFAPCAIICEDCPDDWIKIRGLDLSSEFSNSEYTLFMEIDRQ